MQRLNTTGEWRGLLLEGVAPAGEEVGVYLNAMAGKGTVWFDTVSMVEEE